MHEMSVTQAMLNLALENAGGRRITDVYLEVGQMSAIVPESVEVFFDFLSQDTQAEGATLHFDIAPMEMTCQDCGQAIDLHEWADERPHVIMQRAFALGCACGGKNLRVTAGVEFGLTSIVVEDDAHVDAQDERETEASGRKPGQVSTQTDQGTA
jgi:hydrogenase nickel incorporation protein HypA/HybF